jgi:hypothetical protein
VIIAAAAAAGGFTAVHTLQTPDERFGELPEFPYAPTYCEVDYCEGYPAVFNPPPQRV